MLVISNASTHKVTNVLTLPVRLQASVVMGFQFFKQKSIIKKKNPSENMI